MSRKLLNGLQNAEWRGNAVKLKSVFLACIAATVLVILSSGCGKLETHGLPTVVKVGRTTCIPCRKMSKLLEELEPKLKGLAAVSIVDIDEDPDAVKRFNVTGIPVTIFYNSEGAETYRQIGLLEENEVIEQLGKAGMKK